MVESYMVKKRISIGQSYTRTYEKWKQNGLRDSGYFIIFNGFLDNNILQKISGGALKLYVYLGIKSNNTTGESFYKIETMAEYFQVNTRTITNWINELKQNNLIARYQLKFNGVSHTYLRPYDAGFRGSSNPLIRK